MLALFMAIGIVIASMPGLAQDVVVQHFDVPDGEYSGTDIFVAGDLWNEYIVHVEKNHELIYHFKVVGDGEIMVSLIYGEHPNIYSDHYTSFSTSQPVTEYSAEFPAVIGFDRDYSLVVNSSHPTNVTYEVSIHSEPVEKPDYTLHYILIILGFIALVIFSYKVVVWQEEQEKKSKKEKRRGKNRN